MRSRRSWPRHADLPPGRRWVRGSTPDVLSHGETPPPGLTAAARVAAAVTARGGTRIPRLLCLGVGASADGVRWAREDTGAESERAQARTGYAVAGGITILGAALGVAAARSSGPQRLAWTLAAAASWLAVAWSVVSFTVVTCVARASRRRRTG